MKPSSGRREVAEYQDPNQQPKAVTCSGASELTARVPEWLDAHRWLPFALLAAIPVAVLLPLWIYHLSPDPIWFFSGMVKDVRSGVIAAGLPFGDPNVGWTSQALGHLAALQWIHGKVPWWNAYSGIGLPLAGEMQPGAFFLPFVFLLLLRSGFVWLRIAMQLVGGFSTYALARELGLGRLAALVGGILFELSGTFAFTPGPDSVFCVAAFLPLLLLGIEQLFNHSHERVGILWVAFGIGFSLLAGFPEIAYIDGLLALLWFLCRFAAVKSRWRFALHVAWGGLLGVLLAAPLLAGFWTLAKHSSAFGMHQLGLGSLPIASMPSIFVPYIFGPFPTATENIRRFNPWGVSNYAGLVLVFFALIGVRARRHLSLRILLAAWVVVAWAKTFGLKPVMVLMNHIPFLLQTAFYRYSATSWGLCLILLAAFGLDELRHRKPRLSLAIAGTLAALAVSIYIAWPWRQFWGSQPGEIATMSRFFMLGVGWSLAAVACAGFLLIGWRRESCRSAIGAVLAINALVCFTIPLLSSARPGSVDRAAIQFLKSHLGLSRFYTLHPIEPNYSSYFQLASLNYDGLPIPANFTQFATKRLFPPLPKTGDTIFVPSEGAYSPGSGLQYLFQFLPEYQALGVKYIVTDSGTRNILAPEAKIPVSTGPADPLALKSGDQVQFTVLPPAAPAGSENVIRGFGILIGNYANQADGTLLVRICAQEVCAEGSRPLSQSADNRFFYVPLSQPLRVGPGTELTATVRHELGNHAFAFWIVPSLPGQTQNLIGPHGPIPGKAVQGAFSFGSGDAAVSKVYHDSAIDIFELPHPAPYFSIARGGPCRLDPSSRDSLRAACAAPALLVRRELYMPGWHTSLNGRRVEAQQYHEIFQSFELPSGDSHLRFSYMPPHAVLAACACLFAIAALLAEFALALRRSRMKPAAACSG